MRLTDKEFTIVSVRHDHDGKAPSPAVVIALEQIQIARIFCRDEALAFLKDHPCDLLIYILWKETEAERETLEQFLMKAREFHYGPIVLIYKKGAASQTWVEKLQGIGSIDTIAGYANEVDLLKIADALLSQRTTLPNKNIVSKWEDGYLFQNMVGRSVALIKVFGMIKHLAPYNATVLITGETGTGKDKVARAIHDISARRSLHFVTCNCAALSESLLESELFGHIKGAFTGAVEQRDGLFRHSHGGTLFLDEIGEMPLSLQAKLLRVIEEKTVRAVGADESISIDLRLVVATNKDLWKAVMEGAFRKDLFYRLSVARIEIPPLRERTEDIPLLSDFFLDQIRQKERLTVKGISEEALQLLISFHWPGNIRELKNVLESSAMMATSDLLTIGDLPSYLQEYAISHQEHLRKSPDRSLLESKEKSLIEEAIVRYNGNKARIAHELGLSRRALYRRLEKYDIGS